jgi:hypothetical protein
MTKFLTKLLSSFSLLITTSYAADFDEWNFRNADTHAALIEMATREALIADDEIPGMTIEVKDAVRKLAKLADTKELQRGVMGRFASVPDNNEIEVDPDLEEARSAAEILAFETLGEVFTSLQSQEEALAKIITSAIAPQHLRKLLKNHPELDPAACELILPGFGSGY